LTQRRAMQMDFYFGESGKKRTWKMSAVARAKSSTAQKKWWAKAKQWCFAMWPTIGLVISG